MLNHAGRAVICEENRPSASAVASLPNPYLAPVGPGGTARLAAAENDSDLVNRSVEVVN